LRLVIVKPRIHISFRFKQYRATPSLNLGATPQVWQSLLVSEALKQVTNWITVVEAAEQLNMPIGKIRRLIEEHSLIAIKVDGVQKIPADLIATGEPLPSLKGTIFVLLDSGFNLSGAIDWLYTVEDSLQMTPMAALLAGRKAEIRRLAQALAL